MAQVILVSCFIGEPLSNFASINRRSLYQVVKSCVYYAIEDFPARVNFFRAALFFLSKLDAQSARIL